MANQNLTTQTVVKLQRLIVEGNYQAGDTFASEAELTEKLNVSRQVLREAISRLRGLGVLKSKKRVGLIIAKPDPAELFETVLQYAGLDEASLSALAELRYALEVGAAELAARRARPEQLDRLSELADQYQALPDGDDAQENAIELQFHRAILECAGSPLVNRMHHVLGTFFHKLQVREQWNDESPADKTRSSVEHHMIVEALAAGDAERTRMLLSSHMLTYLNLATPSTEDDD